jgi:hypothetical protein
MIGKSGKHYNNPHVAKQMGDAPDELPEAGGEPHEDTLVEVHKTPGGLRTSHNGEDRNHADFDSLVEHLREALGAKEDGDPGDEGVLAKKPIGKPAMTTAHAEPSKGSFPAPAGNGGLSSLRSV